MKYLVRALRLEAMRLESIEKEVNDLTQAVNAGVELD